MMATEDNTPAEQFADWIQTRLNPSTTDAEPASEPDTELNAEPDKAFASFLTAALTKTNEGA